MILKAQKLKIGIPEEIGSTYAAGDLDLEFVDFHYLQPITLRGLVERDEDTVTFHGHLASRLEQICGRCLGKVVSELNKPVEFVYPIEGRHSIDMTEDMRDALILDYPERFLCSENCKGLCAGCGSNLNQHACICSSLEAER